MKCDIDGCLNYATIIEDCVNYCVSCYLRINKHGEKLKLKPEKWESRFLRLAP